MKEEQLKEFNKIYSQGGFYMRKHLEHFIDKVIFDAKISAEMTESIKRYNQAKRRWNTR